MRLLRIEADNDFSLVEYTGRYTPKYAILSHTWGADHEEVVFRDFLEGTAKSRAGYKKLTFCGEQAAKHGLQFCWVDTCCIDKSSSTELAEAINSMFQWYQQAVVCFAYLADVSVDKETVDGLIIQHAWQFSVRQSKWFTRGWTLQELLAPAKVKFFSREGIAIGDKSSRVQEIHEITGIAVEPLNGGSLSSCSIDERMSWAKERETKREEDTAYCLLGIFDVYMPLIYGEGQRRALSRLRKEIWESSQDETLKYDLQHNVERHNRHSNRVLAEGSQSGKLGLGVPIKGSTRGLQKRVKKQRAPQDMRLPSQAMSGHVPIGAIVESNQRNCSTSIEVRAAVAVVNDNGAAPLYLAATKGHVEMVGLLLKKGADLAVSNNSGWTPLHSAANEGHVEVVELLLEKGADLAVPNSDGMTPVYSAATQGHIEVVRLLLDKGANLAVRKDNGWTPLNSAANNGHVKVVELLLKKGADPAVPNDSGWTPLHSAANNGHVEVAELLLEDGADGTAAASNVQTPQ